ncbi:hypothetical protein EW026_g1195 [Hermanssonia centrifuga]|uniref:Uncharacterized protein n=1 Tax=Hermanssonia centrifuga TaxID=98765 RepID=A0A4S4KS91_9APHY|nr:hypothetical protein EW026_g1195 [Hermanssonia centrifuga]
MIGLEWRVNGGVWCASWIIGTIDVPIYLNVETQDVCIAYVAVPRDLFAFNFSEWNNGPRNPTFFNDGFAEAIRLIEVDLEVLDLDSSPSKFDDPEHPPIVFKGTSHGMHGSIARIEGSVRMFANGVIRWNFALTTVITDGGHAEAVQLGNVCSAVGIGGIWTVAVHEEVGDPAGPFWMWKASEPLPDDLLILPQ